jgi:hypothetical protein
VKAKKQHLHWPRILTMATLVLVTLACSTVSTPSPTATPTRKPIPTWTPVPTLTPTPQPTAGEISGRVIDASSGSPIPKAHVYTNPPTISVTANEQGLYFIPEVVPGIYAITATKSGYASASVSVAVTAGRATTADIHLAAVPTGVPTPTPQSFFTDGLVA